MNKINLVFKYIIALFILSMISSNLYSSSKTIAGIYGGGHDSLLFDGTSSSADYLREECNMKVTSVKGEVWGNILTSEIFNVCGETDTIYKITYGKVKVGDILVSEDFVRTKDFSTVELELKDGKRVWLGPATEFQMGRDYCMGGGIANLFSGSVHVKGGKEGNLYVATAQSMVHITKTEFSVETTKDGEITTDLIRMYEGSVTFGLNMQNKDLSKKNDNKEAEIKKLTKDFQAGRVSIEEFTKKMMEFQGNITASIEAITVNAGFQSRVVGMDNPTEPVPIESTGNEWFDDVNFKK